MYYEFGQRGQCACSVSRLVSDIRFFQMHEDSLFYFIRQKAKFFLLKVSFWARRVIMLKLHKQLGFTTTSRNSYTYLGIQVFRLNSCKQQGTISVFQRVPDGRYLPPRRVANL